jgi:predicted O-methyltransferase YrrM
VDDLQERIRELEAAESRFQMFPPGHYYSPVPDLMHLASRVDIFGRDPADVPGVRLRLAEQWSLLEELAPIAAETPFPAEQEDRLRFWFGNDSYGDGDATTLYALLRYLAPGRLIEIGAGYSTLCTLDTIEYHNLKTALTVIEPYPERLRSLLRPGDEERIRLISAPVEDVPADLVDELGAGDVLFIDSTHVLKTGSDVAYELHHLLPRLAPGVYIHLHDILPGFEYPAPWVFEGRGWNEAYAVRAFLEFNEAFQIKLWPSLLRQLDSDRADQFMPQLARNTGGCLWLRRVH